MNDEGDEVWYISDKDEHVLWWTFLATAAISLFAAFMVR